MKILQTVLPVTLVILVAICSISYFTTDYIRSLRRLKQNSANFQRFEQEEEMFIDLNDEEAMRRQMKKIRHYESIERSPVEHLGLPDLVKEEQKVRKLAENNVFDDVGIVDPLATSMGTLGRWIFRNTKQFQPEIIAYPYSFNYSYTLNETNEKEEKHYSQGAFISLNPNTLDIDNIGLKTNSTLSIKTARALYDTDIAILSVEAVLSIEKENYTQDVFQDAQDWCTFFQGSFGKGSCFANYDIFYNEKVKNTTKTYVTKINETSLLNGKLIGEDGFARFGILIIPDYKLGTETIINSKLTPKGIAALKTYFEKGGNVIATAKSVTLLEDAGLLTKGSYDRNNIFNSDTDARRIQVSGCKELKDQEFSVSDTTDFKKHFLCMGMTESKTPALSSAFKMVKQDASYKTLLSIDPTYGKLALTEIEGGITTPLNDNQKTFLPLVLTKENQNGRGQVMILNFNPVYGNGDKSLTLNAILLALSKEMYMSSKVSMSIDSKELDLPIPSGEMGMQLAVDTLFHNLNDQAIKDFSMYLFLPDHLEWSTLPAGCERSSDISLVPKNILSKKNIEDKTNDYLVCKFSSVDAYEKKHFKLSIIVSDYKATQTKYSVLILIPVVTYKDSEGLENVMAEYVRVNAEAAPVLRVAINPDPSSFYPVKGEGQYVDNVVKIENKELSGAEDVEYIGLIPVVSPLTDGDDQRVLRWNLKIYVDYYNSRNYEVPFKSDNATDYIYTGILYGKGTVIVAEWDSPVLPTKEIKTGEQVHQEVDDIPGINLGKVTIGSTLEVIKQINYRKADLFYKLASQRLMVFVDDSTEAGAKTLYPNGVPAEWQDPVNPKVAKKEFLFLRNDIYFYENENYVNPPNVTEKIVFSVDNYIKYTKNKSGCKNLRGEARSTVYKKGYFDNFEAAHKAKILEPDTYTNELFEYCDLTIVDPTSEADIKKVFGNTDNLRPVHYIVPNVEKNIVRPGQIYGFKETDEHHGYLEGYPTVKFIYLHSLNYVINTETCRYGGIIEISLGNYKLLNVDDVTIAPDQIAVYKTEHISANNTIRAFFKRGLMSNEQFGKNMTLTINIENLVSTSAIKLNVKLHELRFDISFPPNYEHYNVIRNENLDFNYVSVFSYPALELKTKLNRTLNGFETMEPFSRYGVYIQELIAHRYIFGTAETHHQTHPGCTGSGAGFSSISNLGISSIPFLEYVTAGSGQVIPGGTSTSRASWKDVWGRTWNQPLRTVFPDIPPIPPPLKNFMMTTTFALLRGGKIVTEWDSDEDIQIHVHVKLLNNYPKYFEITRCKANEILFVPDKLSESHSREYENYSKEALNKDELNGNKMLLRQGGFASYGSCWVAPGTVVGSEKVEGELLDKINRARVCADYTDENKIAACEKELESIRTLNRLPSNSELSGKQWNYSPLVEQFYPKDYIEDDMWDMTHVDYDDNAMDKAYKYHMDNLLPNYDNGILKPHNTIAIPLYKGLGYDITYSKENSMNYHGTVKKGWWCDNLQNKDDTLVAGQQTCNKISVDKKSSITNWITGEELVGSKRANSNDNVKKIVNNRLGNIYVCLYNRKRPQYDPNCGRNYYASNVVENNIVPVIVSLDKNDKRLSEFDCTDKPLYNPDTLKDMEENYLETSTNKDYLYFAANLRGQAKEAFNVVLNLKHFDQIKYEGIVKVNEGGRFVYWNPANGPNSFLIVDDPVAVINAKRNDIDIKAELFPLVTSTFNTTVYHLYTLADENKVEKVWPFYDYYANNHGYGDVAISVYVGGVRKSKAVLNPGQETYVKIIIMNNCGFDWNMKGNAIEFDYRDSKPISANDLLMRLVHTIQAPTKYNFLEITPDAAYAKYLTIEPSDHNIEVAPEFFDFENINVVTIRDGFKGEYYLKIKVKSDFPDNLRGKPIEIKLKIKPEFFDHFPGYSTDPIKSYHPYTVTMPSVYIAVPFKTGKFAGKVLYTSAQATNLNVNFNMGIDWKVDEIKMVDPSVVDKMRDVLLGDENKFNSELLKVWNSIKSKTLNHTETPNSNGETQNVQIVGLKQEYPLFPKTVLGQPDVANISFLIKSSISQLKYGYTTPITNIKTTFTDWNSKNKQSTAVAPQINAKGPWLEISYTRTLVEDMGNGQYAVKPNQELSPLDDGIMKVQFKLENKGNGNSYNTKYSIVIEKGLEFVGHNSGTSKITQNKDKNEKGLTVLTFDYGTPINAGELKGGIIYLRYHHIVDSIDELTQEQIEALETELKVAKESYVTMDLTNDTIPNSVIQHLRKPLVFAYTKIKKSEVFIEMTVSDRRSDPVVEIEPIVKFRENETESDVQLSLLKLDITNEMDKTRKLAKVDVRDDVNAQFTTVVDKVPLNKFHFSEHPIKNNFDFKQHKVMYTLVMYNTKTKKSSSNTIIYDQEAIGFRTAEIVFILLTIAFYAAAVLLLWFGCKNMRKGKDNAIEKEVRNTPMERLMN